MKHRSDIIEGRAILLTDRQKWLGIRITVLSSIKYEESWSNASNYFRISPSLLSRCSFVSLTCRVRCEQNHPTVQDNIEKKKNYLSNTSICTDTFKAISYRLKRRNKHGRKSNEKKRSERPNERFIYLFQQNANVSQTWWNDPPILISIIVSHRSKRQKSHESSSVASCDHRDGFGSIVDTFSNLSKPWIT